jgi:hypothetical protein
MPPVVDCISGIIETELGVVLKINPKYLTVALSKSIDLYTNLNNSSFSNVYNDFETVLESLDTPDFPELQELKKYAPLMKVAMSLFEGSEINFNKIFDIITRLIGKITSMS